MKLVLFSREFAAMEWGYNFITPGDDVDEYVSTFISSQQLPVTQNDMFSNYDPSLFMADGLPYEMPLEPFHGPTTSVTPPYIWSSIPGEFSVHELWSSAGLGTASSPVTPTGGSTRKNRGRKRRTLSDEDRQAIYSYHEKHKRATHSDIAGDIKPHTLWIFPLLWTEGPSTVTKIINRGGKPLEHDRNNQNRPLASKPSVEKIPKIEEALKNWAIKHQKEGLPMDDRQIIAKAELFATACGRHEMTETFGTQEWLQRFKSENLLGLNPKEPMSSESQSSSNLPTSNNPLSMSESAIKPLGKSPIVADENVAEYPASPNEVDDSCGMKAQAGEAIEAKRAFKNLKTFIRRREVTLDADESALIKNWQRALEEQTRLFGITGTFPA
ncbi:hypothetical protein N7476_005058 [Penicillium atrosanguineum]|uniref:HTH CENPB-type domain-containing protein n=1 Tax=Penicillium atrosanguineum TaxID=1132637 RepID=A0A9W9PYM4_9EURO|nr:hypothetical protein N7476_005058 [Penicillium atrosanguineum]